MKNNEFNIREGVTCFGVVDIEQLAWWFEQVIPILYGGQVFKWYSIISWSQLMSMDCNGCDNLVGYVTYIMMEQWNA